MFKFVILAMVVCAANAGVIGLGHHAVVAAPVAVAHHAESYQNNNLLSVHPVPVVAHVAHVAHAPIAVAHAPVAIGVGLGHHGLLH